MHLHKLSVAVRMTLIYLNSEGSYKLLLTLLINRDADRGIWRSTSVKLSQRGAFILARVTHPRRLHFHSIMMFEVDAVAYSKMRLIDAIVNTLTTKYLVMLRRSMLNDIAIHQMRHRKVFHWVGWCFPLILKGNLFVKGLQLYWEINVWRSSDFCFIMGGSTYGKQLQDESATADIWLPCIRPLAYRLVIDIKNWSFRITLRTLYYKAVLFDIILLLWKIDLGYDTSPIHNDVEHVSITMTKSTTFIGKLVTL